MRWIAALAMLLTAAPAFAQQAAFKDPLVDHLAGKWVLTGQMDRHSRARR